MEQKLNSEQPEEQIEELESISEQESSEELQPAEQKQKKSRRLPVLLRLSRRTTVFLSLTLIATIIFFMTGNQQSFLEANLNLILKIISCDAIALCFFSAASLFQCIFYLVKDRKFRLIFHLAVYLIIFAVSIAVSVLSLTVNLLSEGISF